MRPAALTLIGLFEASALCLCAFSVLHWAAGIHHILELLAHFKVAYGVLSVLMAAGFALLRKWGWVSVLALAFLANASAVGPWYQPARPDSDRLSSPSFKVLLANVQSSNTRHKRLLDFVATERPDVIVLQEVNRNWQAALSELDGLYSWKLEVVRSDNFGIAVYAAQPWLDAESIRSPPLGFPTLIIDGVGGRDLRLITTHPHTPLSQWGFDARNTQLMDIARYVRESSTPVLVVGDLNATMWSPALTDLMEAAGLKNARRGFGLLPTWPTWFVPLMIPLDHGLYTPGLVVNDIRTGPPIGSDHLPLIIEVTGL